ncbi:MAG: SpoIVB peptidase [Firmicutes bacterium]|nr:SpoIVB peptidase [Bacillota bacterium]MCL2255784.1 SpoIVB peptidase [Bacillota bacterium]
MKTRVKVGLSLVLLFVFFFVIYQVTASIVYVVRLPDNLILSQADLDEFNLMFVAVSTNNTSEEVMSDGVFAYSASRDVELSFKLFNIFNFRKKSATVEEKREAYIGGYPIGLSAKIDGILVNNIGTVETYAGKIKPKSDLVEGDVILKINDKKIENSNTLSDILNEFTPECEFVRLTVLRRGDEIKLKATPVIEEVTGRYKLGITVKDSVEGIGTVSFAKEDGSFGSLGHSMSSQANNAVLPSNKGDVYACKISGFEKGTKGNPGELRGVFVDVQNPIGSISKNCMLGVFGTLEKDYQTKKYPIGSRLGVKPGKAKIKTTIGNESEYYNIEIIKTTNQNTPQEKGMLIRITDKKLLSQTGGILQGMSGSPIVQNGKIIGVVTHVLNSDQTKGYGLYLDWMY